jgi:DNA-binding SARP family transcriptional activator
MKEEEPIDRIHVFLLGKFNAARGEKAVDGLEAQKVQELLCYLLIYRNRPHVREKLADLLWQNSSSAQSKQYLRHTLCQLQAALENKHDAAETLISVESDWIQLNSAVDHWSDIQQLEQAFTLTQNQRGRELDEGQAQTVQQAVQLYRGDLLENWYQDWCILERERFQNMYLTMLDKLMSHCTARHFYEQGIVYGAEILRCDIAHERTYRRLMRLRYLDGDRTGALRQFEVCTKALAQELDVKPAAHTLDLYAQIRADRPFSLTLYESDNGAVPEERVSLPALLQRLNHVRTTLIQAQRQIEQDIEIVKTALS